MSFIDLMADHDWSDADITANTEAMVHKEFPPSAQLILDRKLEGIRDGYITDPGQIAAIQAEKQRAAAVAFAAQQAGLAAREDMTLLRQAWAVERGEVAREDAPAEVLALVDQRAAARPQPEPEEEMPE